MITFRTLLSLLILTLALSSLSSAQMSTHLKEEFHDAEAYGVQIIDGLSTLRASLHNEEIRVLAFQSFGEEMDQEVQAEILEWVRAGNSIWFYDARLAPWFGMKSHFFSAEDFRSKPEDGVLGGKKCKGLATVGISLGSHAVQTGVGQVTIFLPEVELEGTEGVVYGGIEPEGDTEILLQSEVGSAAFIACRREGRGFIVFKTLLWNEPLSGDRFQMNLLEYSAGFQVPGPAGVGKVGNPPGPEAEYIEGEPATDLGTATAAQPTVPTTPNREGDPENPPTENTPPTENPPVESEEGPWALELQDGTTIYGEFETKLVEFETGTSSLKLEPGKVRSLEFGSAIKLDRIVTVAGKEKSGLLLTSPIKFRTSRGVEEFEKEDLVKLFRSAE